MPIKTKFLKLKRILSGLFQLSWREFALTFKISLLIIRLPLLQKLLPLPSLLKHLTPCKNIRKSPSQENSKNLELIVSLTRRILWQRVWIFHPTCLKRSLVMYHFLRKYGYPVHICFGVTKSDQLLTGHSWITLNGEAVSEFDDLYLSYDIAYEYPESSL